MSDDIITRLRYEYCSCLEDYRGRGRIDPQCESCNTLDERLEAAAEIEQLRASLALSERQRVALERIATLLCAQHQATRPGHNITDWRLVPVDPTQAMIDAADAVKSYELATPWNRWAAMLAAAPTSPAQSRDKPIAWHMSGLLELAYLDGSDTETRLKHGWAPLYTREQL